MTFDFLPTNKDEMKLRGWDSVDIILISGDAYVDHPSFGAALIGRYLESHGYKVGLIPQPDWTKDEDFLVLGKPNLYFAISAGNLDSMVANMTSEKKKRKMDMYTPDNQPGKRPNMATIVYSNMIRKLYPGVPIILGGIEASLRRISYYDYWSNKLRRSLIFDARADLLAYGMCEKAMVEIGERLRDGVSLDGIGNTVAIKDELPYEEYLELSSYEKWKEDKALYAKESLIHEQEYARKQPRIVVQPCQNKYVVINPPDPLNSEQLGNLFFLPFQRAAHPRYKKPIPAYSFVKDSVLSHRGCYGGCSFCTLGLHQGKFIVTRSEESICREVSEVISKDEDFKGNILDVGGPSANMYGSECTSKEGCKRLSCVVPSICKHLKMDHERELKLLRKVKSLPGIKRVFVNSGIRYDMAITCDKYIDEITANYVSGQMSVAPEHIKDSVLRLMNKPSFTKYLEFKKKFDMSNKKAGKKQFVIPYFISSHPGCTLQDMYDVAMYMKKNNLKVEQVQNFLPIPMTLSSTMYYTGIDPFSGKHIHIAKGEERLMQRALLQPYLKSNHRLVRTALKRIGKEKDFAFLTGSKSNPKKR